MPTHQEHANLIWQIADLLRGPYRPPQYERVMLPMTVLRRFDCVLAPSKAKVVAEHRKRKDRLTGEALDRVLDRAAGQRFHNHSDLTFEKLRGDPDHIDKHLVGYIKGFSANVRRIFEYFEFDAEIEKMREADVLYKVVSRFCAVDLHPAAVPNSQMGLIFENLIRRFNELANETAGDHFTPREVIRLMVHILFIDDDKLLASPGTVKTLLDPACGTGGMLAEAQNYLREYHPDAQLYTYGQDYNKHAFATAASDMLIKEVAHNGAGDNVRFGDSFTQDRFDGERFDYFLTNPPFGVDWKKQQKEIQREHDARGFDGRFGAGLPRVNDGSLLFLQHMVDKFERVTPAEHKHGSRLAIVFSGSPLFTGGAGSGESDIRKWIIENDWLEAIVALPEQMFYNTGIGTYIWIVTNRKEKRRKKKIQLLDAREFFVPMRRSQGDKRRKLGEKEEGEPDQIGDIVRLYGRFLQNERSKIFDNADFGYTRVTVERSLRLRCEIAAESKARFLEACPHLVGDLRAIEKALGPEPRRDWNAVSAGIEDLLRARKSRWKDSERKLFRAAFTCKDPEAEPVLKNGGEGCEPDPELRDFENVPLKDDIKEYFRREVAPHAPDAWMDRGKDKIGYEINFNRHFYRYTPPRPLEEIDADLKHAEQEILRLLREVAE
ncbi:MAG: type I restriction-modification system subunit M [Bryobacteraceae bacterium]